MVSYRPEVYSASDSSKNKTVNITQNNKTVPAVPGSRNMKITVRTIQEVEVSTLKVSAGVRYWDDAIINGVEDKEGDLTPCRDGDRWKPVINLQHGQITNWEDGKTADIHFKVCDDGCYELLDRAGNVVVAKEGYVPEVMCPGGSGYGDYIIMKIDERGFIEDWAMDVTYFEEEND